MSKIKLKKRKRYSNWSISNSRKIINNYTIKLKNVSKFNAKKIHRLQHKVRKQINSSDNYINMPVYYRLNYACGSWIYPFNQIIIINNWLNLKTLKRRRYKQQLRGSK